MGEILCEPMNTIWYQTILREQASYMSGKQTREEKLADLYGLPPPGATESLLSRTKAPAPARSLKDGSGSTVTKTLSNATPQERDAAVEVFRNSLKQAPLKGAGMLPAPNNCVLVTDGSSLGPEVKAAKRGEYPKGYIRAKGNPQQTNQMWWHQNISMKKKDKGGRERGMTPSEAAYSRSGSLPEYAEMAELMGEPSARGSLRSGSGRSASEGSLRRSMPPSSHSRRPL